MRNTLFLHEISNIKVLFQHYISIAEGHNGFLEDVSITLIDKTDGSNPTKRETFCMHTLKTLALYGLKVENGI